MQLFQVDSHIIWATILENTVSKNGAGGNLAGSMDENIKEIGKMTRSMVLEVINGQMKENIKVNGKIIR